MFFEYLKAILYGIVEGITEWMPVSSTGHLIILEKKLPLELFCSTDYEFYQQYLSMFEVVIQLGAILAVLCIYFSKLNPFSKAKKEVFSLWAKLLLSTLPAAVIGILSDKLCEALLGKNLDFFLFRPSVVACSLIIYGILFILVEKLSKGSGNSLDTEVSFRCAFAIGCFQALAIIPGTSRSGATILGARILGVPRTAAAEFSFFAAIPIIASASILKTFDFVGYTLKSKIPVPPEAFFILLVAGTVAFLVSMLTIKVLTDFVKRHTFVPFGIYRIILGLAVLFFL